MAKRVALSLDGGGRLGVVSATWLKELELALGKPPHKTYDLVGGTSTGGLIATAIAAGLPSCEILALYRNRMRDIFGNAIWPPKRWFRSKYSISGLRDVLGDVLGAKKLRDARTPYFVTTYDIDRRAPSFFKSWDPNDRYVPMREAAMATAAAPTYLPAVEIRGTHHVDGGVYMPNPSVSVLAEAMDMYSMDEIILLSLGTGTYDKTGQQKGLRNGGLLKWAKNFSSTSLDGTNSVAHYQCKHIAQNLPNVRYFRVDVALPFKFQMDDSSRELNDVLEYNALRWVADNRLYFNEIVEAIRG